MTGARVFPSTTSHKREPFIPTLNLFASLGFREIDLNLNHIIDGGADVAEAHATLTANGQQARVVSGGWCDFFKDGVGAEETRRSVERQVELTRMFGARMLRLFFGRLPLEAYTPRAASLCAKHIRRLADGHPDLLFAFENHDGASANPSVCRTVLDEVDRSNVRLTFDPINFEHRGTRAFEALRALNPVIAHVHLKGYTRGTFCGFGEGDVDLTRTIRALVASGYEGAFTVEYEGAGDRTKQLVDSVGRARIAVQEAELPGDS